MKTKLWMRALALAAATLVVACGDDSGGGDGDMGDIDVDMGVGDMGGADTGVDMGDMGSDPCEGIMQCAAAGTSCDGDTLTTCAPNPDGCLIETTEDCAAVDGGFCDDEAATPACDVDPCFGLDLCDAESRACDGDSLVICAMDANGCIVEETTDCAATDDGVCDAEGEMPVCATPVDPCAGLPDSCPTEGVSCDGDVYVSCLPDAFGCLREARTPCMDFDNPDAFCDDSTTPICADGAECTGDDICTTEGTSCDGPDLVTCAFDPFGCLRETRTTCTTVMFGVCDESGAAATCAALPLDPCRDVVECTDAGRTCDADSLNVCAPDASGCLIEAITDCTATDAICAPEDPASCELVPCAAARTVVDCAAGTLSLDTSMGTDFFSGNACDGSSSYAPSESAFTFIPTEDVRVTFAATAAPGTTDEFDLFVLEGSDTPNTCDDTSPCLGFDNEEGADGEVTVDLRAGSRSYVLYDALGMAAGPATTVDIAISCVVPECGNGVLEAFEACDDDNVIDMDGCSSSCEIEMGFECGGEPSTCDPLCQNGLLDPGEGCDDDNDIAMDGCSPTCEIEAGFGCSGEPSVCEPLCGNGMLDMGETCDDGNTAAGDGCSAVCATETNYVCTGAPSRCILTFTGSIDATDPTWSRPGASCTGSNPDRYYDTFTFTNTAAVDVDYLVTASWADDGYLFVYDSPFDPVMPLTNCVIGDDDFDGTLGSQLEFTAAPGATYVIVATAFDDLDAIGAYTIEVEATCGNGALDPGEFCDDGNQVAGDGCTAACTVEAGFVCRTTGCSMPSCGNMSVEVGESCDDGNMTTGDGCNLCADEIPAVGAMALTFTGSLEMGDAEFDRPGQSCTLSTFDPPAADHYFDEHYITNSTGAAVEIDVVATWSDDGYLFIYDAATFDPADPETGCLAGNDDAPVPVSTGGSEILDFEMPAGAEYVIVATTFDEPRVSIMSYTINVTSAMPAP
ncbi:MAG: DUF4215 domain-containing protein [Myxococcota bacterium]